MKEAKYFTLDNVANKIYNLDKRFTKNTFLGLLMDWKIIKEDFTPYAKHIKNGNLEVKFKDEGKSSENSQPVTLVTGKGLSYLTNRILKEFSKDGAKDEM
jgi:phage antirepressor YoqD-like protein